MTAPERAGVPADLAERARVWIEGDPDPHTRAELEHLVATGATEDLEARLGGRLEFGTAGLRGPLGAGPARMNLAVVRTTTAALCRWLSAHHEDGAVVVGHDARHGSAAFASDAAATVSAAGRDALLSGPSVPTPVAAYAVRHAHAAAGVVVTASHNPAPDNGYKVYDSTGSQIVPPADVEIAQHIERVGAATEIATDSTRVDTWPDDVVDAYVAVAADVAAADGPRDVRIVYTPVHGVGRDVLMRCLAESRFDAPVVVPEQANPDPTFPTAPFPNPEEPGVLDLALALARECRADVVLANDPDADRLAVAFPDPVTGEWTRLSGDELGVLLGDRLLARTTGDDRVVATSIVSASWLARVAAAHGVPCRTTLTGFKWLSRAGDADGRRLVFAYEEALGYAVTDAVRDKDGITAAVAVAELAAELRATGRTVFDEIAELAARHGGSATAQLSVRYDGTDALSQMRQLMERLRASEPEHVGGRTVRRTIDVLDGLVRDGSGRTERSDLPSADVLVWELEGDARVIVRPSGTEPKLKCYLEVPLRPAEPTRDDLARARADSDRALARLRAAAEHLLRV